MDRTEATEKWRLLGEKVRAIAETMSEAADPNDKDGENALVKLWAIALLCRTTNNFAGMELMLGNGLIVEARTMLRCMYENLFRIGYLVSKKYDAVKTWLSEHDASNKATGNELLKWTEDHNVEEIEEFTQFMGELNKKDTTKSGMQTQAVAAGLKEHYITYRMLSADSAHPTARVLSRHARQEEDGSLTISGASFWSDDNEELETRSLACMAYILICIGVDHIVGLGQKQLLDECSAECSKLPTDLTIEAG
jgi:hypothetical protein